MNAILQDVAVGGIVLGALGWLVWRRVTRRRTGATCPDCPMAETTPRIALDPSRTPAAPPRVQVLYDIERRHG